MVLVRICKRKEHLYLLHSKCMPITIIGGIALAVIIIVGLFATFVGDRIACCDEDYLGAQCGLYKTCWFCHIAFYLGVLFLGYIMKD